jgi:hypothetical protein
MLTVQLAVAPVASVVGVHARAIVREGGVEPLVPVAAGRNAAISAR